MVISLINQMLGNSKAAQTQQSQSLTALRRVEPQLDSGKKQYNPFMAAMNRDSQEFQDMYGVNRPLPKPMFLGYRDNQALYGGSRLFILY